MVLLAGCADECTMPSIEDPECGITTTVVTDDFMPGTQEPEAEQVLEYASG